MATATPTGPIYDLQDRESWRRWKSNIAIGLMVLSLALVGLPLVLVLYTVISRGIDVISTDFLTGGIGPQISKHGAMGPAVVGTILITGAATLMAVPLGILGAIYLNEYGGKKPLAQFIRFMTYVMTGVPSIVMGLFIFTIWVLRYGFSGFAGALALACLMLPVVIRSTEEMLLLVPNNLREASYALGASKARVTVGVVLPAALGGIVSGCLLAIARAAGETAPLLFTILTTTEINRDLFNGPNTALATQIFVNATSPYESAQARAWGASLTLIAIVFVLTVAARLITRRLTTAKR
jgi:phosphate transport system permease protein